jgi:hypothetical protein
MILDPEDEAFNEIERQAKQRKEAVLQALHKRKEAVLQALHSENERLGLYKDAYGQQEPVIDKSAAIRIATSLGWSPQRTWEGLTDEEMNEIYISVEEKVNEHWENGGTTMMFPPTLYKAIEAKLKEKNNA